MDVSQQIRDAVKALLTNLTTTEDRVLVTRGRPLEKDFEPTLLIYTASEQSRVFGLSRPRTLINVMSLRIEGHVVADESPDDVLDQIATEVKTKMAGAPRLGYLVKDMRLVSITRASEAAGDRHNGAVRLEYSVTYSTKETTSGVAA